MLTETNKRPALVLLMALFLLELIRTAWISDDAAITLKTVLNFLYGHGPTFNIDERVQAYTHPLWFFLISGTSLVVGNVFAATYDYGFPFPNMAYAKLGTGIAFGPHDYPRSPERSGACARSSVSTWARWRGRTGSGNATDGFPHRRAPRRSLRHNWPGWSKADHGMPQGT